MGTTFSISLPMQRISQHALDAISRNPAFGRYANPAVSSRISHDLVRSSQKNPLQNDESSKSMKSRLSIRRYSTDNLLPLLQNVPGVTDAGGGPLRHDIKTDVRPTAERSPLHEPPSMAWMASSRSLGDELINQTILDDAEKYHILVVDDSPLNRKMLCKLLKSRGHVIEEAADGQQCVDKVKQEADAGRNYDVILMDFVMPVMDGPTATRAIRAMDVKSPIFGLTGNQRTA